MGLGLRIDTVALAIDDNCDNGFLRNCLKVHPDAIKTIRVRDFVSSILRRVGDRRIELLRVFGHGTDGEQNVGGGFPRDNQETCKQGFDVDPKYDNEMCIKRCGTELNHHALLSRLCGRFTANAVVELHGCHTGRNSKGLYMCRALAKLWNVRVRAGIAKQYPDQADNFEGTFIEVWPDGRATLQYKPAPGSFLVYSTPGQKAARPEIIAVHRVGQTIRESDWLSSIAGKHYGDLLLWPILFDHNRSSTFSNPNRMVPGMSIEIPRLPSLTAAQRQEVRQRGRNWRST